MRTGVIQITRLDHMVLNSVEEAISSMGVEVEVILQPIGSPFNLLDWDRVQFKGDSLFRWFRATASETLDGAYDSIMGIGEIDAFDDGKEYILNVVSDNLSISFIQRLWTEETKLYLERVRKLVINSWGRGRGIIHDSTDNCIFHEVQTVEELDRIVAAPCSACRVKLQMSTTKVRV